MAAVIVPINRLGEYRKAMAGLRTKGSLAFHMQNERMDSRKRAASVLMNLEFATLISCESIDRNPLIARESLLTVLVGQTVALTGSTYVLDRSTHSGRDRDILMRLKQSRNFEFQFASRYEEVGLWGCDILAWGMRSTLLGQTFNEYWAIDP